MDFITSNSLRQLQQPVIENDGSALVWDEAMLFLEESGEQYIEKDGVSVATLYYKPGLDEATFLRLVKPWLLKAKEEHEPYHPAQDVVELVRDLTGPEAIEREGNLTRLWYGGDEAITIKARRGQGIRTLSRTWSNGPHPRISVGESIDGRDWEPIVAEWLDEHKRRVLQSRARPEQTEAMIEAADRTDDFEAEIVEFCGEKTLVGFRRLEDDKQIDLELETRGDYYGIWRSRIDQKTIGLDVRALEMEVPDFLPPETEEETTYLRTLKTCLHELGHAHHQHEGAGAGFGDGYCWSHELQAEDYVIQHARSKDEAECFEKWALRNLRSKHY